MKKWFLFLVCEPLLGPGCRLALAADSSQPAADSSLDLPDSSLPAPDSSHFGFFDFRASDVAIEPAAEMTVVESR